MVNVLERMETQYGISCVPGAGQVLTANAALRPRTGEQVLEHAGAQFRWRYAHRIQTGCVYWPQPRETYGALLLASPRFAREYTHYHEWCPGLAPRRNLLAAYQKGRLSWEQFAARYLGELTAFRPALAVVRARVARVLDAYPTITFLGCELGTAGEAGVRCPRRLLRAWLLDEAVPEVQAGVRVAAAVA